MKRHDLNKLRPSEVLHLGILSWVACDKDDRYRVVPSAYHEPFIIPGKAEGFKSKITGVCMAGGVMAKVLCATLGKAVMPDHYVGSAKALYNLDIYVRKGFYTYCKECDIDLSLAIDLMDDCYKDENRNIYDTLFSTGYDDAATISEDYIRETLSNVALLKEIGY